MGKMKLPESVFEQEPQIDSPTANLSRQAETAAGQIMAGVAPDSADQNVSAESSASSSAAESNTGEANEHQITTQPRQTARTVKPAARGSETKFLSTRAPSELGFAIDLAILELGMDGFSCDKGELLAALVHEHVKSDEKKLAGLQRAVENFRREFGQ